VFTEYYNGETNYKNSLQYISNGMCKRCNPFQCVCGNLQLKAQSYWARQWEAKKRKEKKRKEKKRSYKKGNEQSKR